MKQLCIRIEELELKAHVTVGSPAALLAPCSTSRHIILLSNYCLFLVGTSPCNPFCDGGSFIPVNNLHVDTHSAAR